MDIQRPRSRQYKQPQAVDGFFSKPSASRPRPGTAPVRPGSQRLINDFGRADGFHSAPRRSVQSAAHTHVPVAGAKSPATTKALASHALASQFADIDSSPQSRRSGLSKLSKQSKRRSRSAARLSTFRMFRKWAFRTTAAMLVLLIIGGGFLATKGYFQFKKVFHGSASAVALKTDVDPTLLKGEGDGRVNILMLGVGGAGHDGGDLTDTLMVASVDPINNQAVLLSIPRDLWTKMPNNYISSYQKINAAYESGKYKYLGKQDISNANTKAVQAGFQAADGTVERVVGIPIHYNVLVDFQAFRQAIDTVGGVAINAPEQLYDPTMAWENERSPVLAKLGINNFDGKHALNYVRSRETSSDFARSQRQRAVLVALKDKVMGLGTLSNPVKLSNLLSAFGNNVQTDIPLGDMTRMATIMKKISNNQIQSVGLADAPNNFLTTGNINGLSVVQPRAGLEDYTAIQTFVRTKLKDGYIAQENARVSVFNGTVVPGLATEKADELKSYGYNVVAVDNAPTTDYDTTQIIDLSKGNKKYTLNYLKKRYHVTTVKTALPAGTQVQNPTDIVILLGQDASTTP